MHTTFYIIFLYYKFIFYILFYILFYNYIDKACIIILEKYHFIFCILYKKRNKELSLILCKIIVINNRIINF